MLKRYYGAVAKAMANNNWTLTAKILDRINKRYEWTTK